MAGLRGIKLLDRCTQDDFARLGEELAGLKPDLAFITRFRDWLWTDGAEGFDVLLDESFTEGIDTAFDNIRARREALSALRMEAAVSVSEQAVYVASSTLDQAAARDEFQVPLDNLARAIRSGGIQLKPEELTELRKAVEDPLYWAEAEVDVALEYESLRAALPAKRLARRIIGMMSDAADLKVLNLLSVLSQRTDPYSRNLQEALEEEPLGEAIAGNLQLNETTLKMVHQIVTSPGLAHLAMGLITGLLERSCMNKRIAKALLTLAIGIQQKIS